MSKRIYRAVDVKQVDLERLAERVRGKRLIVGIDIAKAVQFAALMLEDKQVLKLVRWNQLEGWTGRVIEGLQSLGASSLEVVLEPSGTYGDPLRHALQEAGVAVNRMHPKRSRDYAEVYDGVPSQHDGKSVVLLGRLHLEGFSERWEPRSETQRDLSAGLKVLELHHEAYQRQLNRLEGLMARHWPELSTVMDLKRRTVLALLWRYGSPQAVASAGSKAHAWMLQAGGGSVRTQAAEILASASTTMSVSWPKVDWIT